MSTDYGFLCSCGNFWIDDNVSLDDIRRIEVYLPSYALLFDAMQGLRGDVLITSVISGSSLDLDDLLEFAKNCKDHKKSIVNEYLYFYVFYDLPVFR